MAHRAGMPASGFVAAANANRGFVDFLDGAGFESRPSIATASNAMDVGAPSNLERILCLYGGDAAALRRDVVGASVSDDETARCIADVYADTGYVLDPHSAVAYEAAKRHDAASDEPTVILATAHPAKFPEIVEATIAREIPLPPGLARVRDRVEHMHEIEPTFDALSATLEDIPA
jgi:threonine synthase